MVRLACLLTVALGTQSASAHEKWANGEDVPAWVKRSCCGPDDVHHLTADQVHAMAGGWHIAGYPYVVQYGRETPSQDGDYWLFYKAYPDGSFTPIYCFFAPLRGT